MSHENVTCIGCDHTFHPDDTAPVQRNADGSMSEACRKCVTKWIREGWLWRQFPFWTRKKGLDQ